MYRVYLNLELSCKGKGKGPKGKGKKGHKHFSQNSWSDGERPDPPRIATTNVKISRIKIPHAFTRPSWIWENNRSPEFRSFPTRKTTQQIRQSPFLKQQRWKKSGNNAPEDLPFRGKSYAKPLFQWRWSPSQSHYLRRSRNSHRPSTVRPSATTTKIHERRHYYLHL